VKMHTFFVSLTDPGFLQVNIRIFTYITGCLEARWHSAPYCIRW